MQLRGMGFFGKVPVAGDFQRHVLPEGPDARVLDWFNDGWTRHALTGRRPDLQAPMHFVWRRPDGGHVVFGVMVASRDRAGRRFPLLVFGVADPGVPVHEVVTASIELRTQAVSVAESGRAGASNWSRGPSPTASMASRTPCSSLVSSCTQCKPKFSA